MPPAPAPVLPNVPSTSQPQEEASGSQPRASGCERRPAICPDNVYGSRNPTQSEQMSNREFRELIEGVPAPSGDNKPNSPPGEGQRTERANYLVKTVQEGGANLINFLVRAAVSSTDAKEKIPNVSKRSLKHSISATSLSSPTCQKVVKPLAVDGSLASNQMVIRRPDL